MGCSLALMTACAPLSGSSGSESGSSAATELTISVQPNELNRETYIYQSPAEACPAPLPPASG